jgi:pyridoxamine 5'-phosphate oxidase
MSELSPGEVSPLVVFERWYAEALSAQAPFADAMALATANSSGEPSVRMVLFKGVSGSGIRFFTNFCSRKARELLDNPRAAVVFHWPLLGRQLRIEGTVEVLGAEEADAYFASRPRASQIGAWASPQSEVIDGHDFLEHRIAEFESRFHGGAVPRPDFWGGYRLVPRRFEFWTDGASRLHERVVYDSSEGTWRQTRLAP